MLSFQDGFFKKARIKANVKLISKELLIETHQGKELLIVFSWERSYYTHNKSSVALFNKTHCADPNHEVYE